jgi:agmatine/peptidylarginine deiminase
MVGLGWFCAVQWGVSLLGHTRTPDSGDRQQRSAAPNPARTSAGATRPLPLPGEFETQSALLLSGSRLAKCFPDVLADVVAAAHRDIRIVLLVAESGDRGDIRRLLRRRGLSEAAVSFMTLPHATTWVRDYGPIFVRRADDTVVVADGVFGRSRGADRTTSPWDDDSPALLAARAGLPVEAVSMYLEGGNLLTNGDGLIVSTHALASTNSPRGLDRRRIKELLGRHFGCRTWVSLVPPKSEPTGHVDLFATFVAPDVAVVASCEADDDPVNAGILDRAAATLKTIRTSRGPVKVHRIPMPRRRDGLWRSYTNVIFANGTLLVPAYADVAPGVQRKALDVYRRLLPTWRIVPIAADALAARGGMLHCISLNVPAYVAPAALAPDKTPTGGIGRD